MKNKLIIVAGCSGSGKSSVSEAIKNSFNEKDAQIICLDRFYKRNADLMPKVKTSGNPNFDHPDSFDWQLLYKCLSSLLHGKKCSVPRYDYFHHKRLPKGDILKPTKILILEGVLALYSSKINRLAELKLFVDTSTDLCLSRRIERDQKQRGRSTKSVITQWNESVKPMYHKYVKPRRWVSDFLIPWDKPNKQGLKYLIASLKAMLQK